MYSDRRFRVAGIALAICAAIGVHLTWYWFVNTPTGQAIDRAAFEGALIQQTRLWQIGRPVLDIVSRTLVVIGAVVAVVVAVLRRRGWLAIQALLVIVGANLTTQAVKSLYSRPRLLSGWTGQNSLPSGHTTVVAAVSVAMLLTVPRRWRAPTAIIGAIWTLVTGLATLVGRWHRPADVVAALLVVGFWGAVAMQFGTERSLDRPHLAKYRPPLLTSGVMITIAALSAALAIIALVKLQNLVGSQGPDPEAISRLLEQGQVTAYLGGIAAVTASVFGIFGLLLGLRHATLATIGPPAHHDKLPQVRYGATQAGVYAPTQPSAIEPGSEARVAVFKGEM